ncbi:MAG: hypothetical protein EOO92_15425, partial [Pedobacter sp.]
MRYLPTLLLSLIATTAFTQKVNQKQLIIDLNADQGVVVQKDNLVEKWQNQAKFSVKDFSRRDEGRTIAGTGRPLLVKKVSDLRGHSSVVFNKQELVNMDEDAFDHLITGGGYTWFAVLKAGKQSGELKDVNCFFGNLRNKPNNEGMWGGFADDN